MLFIQKSSLIEIDLYQYVYIDSSYYGLDLSDMSHVVNTDMINIKSTILCWLLAISVALIPLASNADRFTLPMENKPCHEMAEESSSYMKSNDTTVIQLIEQLVDSINSRCCCNNCACSDMLDCSIGAGHLSPFIIVSQSAMQAVENSQIIIENIDKLQSQKPSPQ